MRLVDFVLRQGHLSEAAITRALLDGVRPAHLDQCDVCAHRAHDLGRWLDDVRLTAVAAADEAFPAERLAAQQAQIARRLAQIDEPARVIAFPTSLPKPARESSGRRVAPAWVGVAAAAGLVIGVVGGQMAARLQLAPGPASVESNATAAPSVPASQPIVSQPDAGVVPASVFEWELDRVTPGPLQSMDDMTPRLVQTSLTVAQRY